MDKIIHSKAIVFGFPILVFLLDVGFTLSGERLIELTSPWMHFAGGASMGLFFLYFWEENLRLSAPKSKFLFTIISVAAFAVLIGTLWEFAEFIIQKLFPKFHTQPSLADTMADLFLDFFGGLSVAFLYSKSKSESILS